MAAAAACHAYQSDEGTSLSRDLRVNEMIRVPNVRVVDEEGSQLGVMPTHQALHVAQERGYDLVEVAPTATPPVVKFLDYGQFKYEQARKEKEARRHQRSVEFKEIRLKPKIGKGDFDTKVRRAIEFLEDGDRVKVTVQFRGREVSHAYIGRDLLTPVRGADQGPRHRRAAAVARRQVDVHDRGIDPQTEDVPRRQPAPMAPGLRGRPAPTEPDASQRAPAPRPPDGPGRRRLSTCPR